MDKKQAQNIIKENFESSFDKGRFTGFIKNLLNRIEEAPFIYKGKYIPDAYKQYISTLERIGKYSDGENSIDYKLLLISFLVKGFTMGLLFIALIISFLIFEGMVRDITLNL